MRVLVIGGTQFNGYFLVQELLKEGHTVTLINRGKTQAQFPDEVERLLADRTDAAALKSVLENREFDCVQDMCAYHPDDIKLVLELFENRVGHYIFPSSTAIYASSDTLPITEESPLERGETQNEYGLHKILCEEMLFEAYQERGFPATSVPFSMVMGPRNIIPDREQRMLARIISGRPVLVPGEGTTLGQVGDVMDQARALCMLMGNPETFGKRYNLTGGQHYSDLDYVQTFERVLGKKANLVYVPSNLMDALWDGQVPLDPNAENTKVNVDIRSSQTARKRQVNMAGRYKLASLIQRLSPNIHRWNKDVFFSIERLCTDTGFQPEFDLEAMVGKVYDWVQEESISHDFNWALEDQILDLIRQKVS